MARSAGEAAQQVCAQAAARLATVFGALPAALIDDVVRRAEQELRGQVGPDALGELLERLAAHRLAELLGSDGAGGG
jgi:hypothetical protein